MENRAHALAAGIFTLIFVIALIVAALWLRGDKADEDTYILVSKSSVSGLNPQAAVRYRGLQVGRVDDIKIDRNNPRTLLIKISIDNETPVTRSTFARLGYQGLTGLAYIHLDDDGTSRELLQTKPSNPARIPIRPSLFDELSAAAPQMLARVSEVANRINLLLSEENRASISRTLANVEKVSARFIVLQNKLEPTLDALPGIANETRDTMQRANQLMANLNTLTTELRQQVTTLERIGDSAEKIGKTSEAVGDRVLSSALPKFDRLMDDLTRTTRNLDRVLLDIERQPQSLIFGKPPIQPGPGEKGFVPPQ